MAVEVTPAQIAWQVSREALVEQRAGVESIRSRATGVLTAIVAVAVLMGGLIVRDGQSLSLWLLLPAVPLLAGTYCALEVIRTRHLEFNQSARWVLDANDGPGDNVGDELLEVLARDNERTYDKNELSISGGSEQDAKKLGVDRVRFGLALWLRLAGWSLPVQVLCWLFAAWRMN